MFNSGKTHLKTILCSQYASQFYVIKCKYQLLYQFKGDFRILGGFDEL